MSQPATRFDVDYWSMILVALASMNLLVTFFTHLDTRQLKSDRKEMDYSIDIYDPGDGTIQLKDLRDGEVYVIPFDSLQEKIMELNL